MQIQLKENQSKGYAIATEDGKTAGKMSYSIPAADFIIIDHTEVDSTFRGRSIGKQMLNEIVVMARQKNLKIMPLCPFANAVFQKLTDIQDVLKK